MGLSIRKRIILPNGFAINLGNTGPRLSFGMKHLRLSAGQTGVRLFATEGPFRYQKSLHTSSASRMSTGVKGSSLPLIPTLLFAAVMLPLTGGFIAMIFWFVYSVATTQKH